jgi:hypothetical protein
LSAAHTQDDHQFPETRDEQIVVACCLALLFAGLVAIIAAYTIAATAAAIAFVSVFLTLALYIVRFLSADSRPETLLSHDHENQCHVCGTPFSPIRVNQIYCGRACRAEAAARRRENRRRLRRRLDVVNAERQDSASRRQVSGNESSKNRAFQRTKRLRYEDPRSLALKRGPRNLVFGRPTQRKS